MFKKLLNPRKKNQRKLNGIVNKSHDTGFLFVNIMNDLGESVEPIMADSKLNQMAYGYARRSAAAALYLQGLIDEDNYDHNLQFFKAIQIQTEHSVEFQEQAFTESIDFMQTYSPVITRLLLKQMLSIAHEFERPEEQLSDVELIEIVMNAYVS